jgi:pantoate--beta-alanine ligase
VCTVVLKLFHLVQPDVAVFGKKDRQQLKIVRGMVQQFNMRIQVVPARRCARRRSRAVVAQQLPVAAERAEAPTCIACCAASPRDRGRPHGLREPRAAGARELAQRGWKVDYVAVRHGLALRIPHPEGYDHRTC